MSYLAHTHKPALVDALKNIEQATHDRLDTFQSVLVTGLSGVVPGSIFCHMYNKDLIVLRKDREHSHGRKVEGKYNWDNFDAPGYIILDDFVARGETLSRLMEAHGNSRFPEFVVLYSYKCGLAMQTPFFTLDADPAAPGVCRFTIKPRTKP